MPAKVHHPPQHPYKPTLCGAGKQVSLIPDEVTCERCLAFASVPAKPAPTLSPEYCQAVIVRTREVCGRVAEGNSGRCAWHIGVGRESRHT